MAKKIDAASANGVDHFLFDCAPNRPSTPCIGGMSLTLPPVCVPFTVQWVGYWYNETSTDGVPGLFQDSALEQGFLAAPNRNKMDFALMSVIGGCAECLDSD